MNSQNLAVIFGPNILRNPTKKSNNALTDNDHVIKIVQLMIEHWNFLFTVRIQ